jgi:hypothetical protein
MKISRVILTGGVVAMGVVLAMEAPGVLKLALGILWGGVVFVAALVLLAAALAIIAPGAPDFARAGDDSAAASEAIVGPIDREARVHTRPTRSVEHGAVDSPPASSGSDRPAEDSGADPIGHYQVPRVNRF